MRFCVDRRVSTEHRPPHRAQATATQLTGDLQHQPCSMDGPWTMDVRRADSDTDPWDKNISSRQTHPVLAVTNLYSLYNTAIECSLEDELQQLDDVRSG